MKKFHIILITCLMSASIQTAFGMDAQPAKAKRTRTKAVAAPSMVVTTKSRGGAATAPAVDETRESDLLSMICGLPLPEPQNQSQIEALAHARTDAKSLARDEQAYNKKRSKLVDAAEYAALFKEHADELAAGVYGELFDFNFYERNNITIPINTPITVSVAAAKASRPRRKKRVRAKIAQSHDENQDNRGTSRLEPAEPALILADTEAQKESTPMLSQDVQTEISTTLSRLPEAKTACALREKFNRVDMISHFIESYETNPNTTTEQDVLAVIKAEAKKTKSDIQKLNRKK